MVVELDVGQWVGVGGGEVVGPRGAGAGGRAAVRAETVEHEGAPCKIVTLELVHGWMGVFVFFLGSLFV